MDDLFVKHKMSKIIVNFKDKLTKIGTLVEAHGYYNCAKGEPRSAMWGGATSIPVFRVKNLLNRGK